MTSLATRLQELGLLRKVVLSPAVAVLLAQFEIKSTQKSPDGTVIQPESGTVNLTGKHSFPFFALDILPPEPIDEEREYSLEVAPGKTGFTLAVALQGEGFRPIFRLTQDAVGRALKPAVNEAPDPNDPEREALKLDPAGGEVVLTGEFIWLVVTGQQGQSADLRLAPSKSGKALVTLKVQPSTVMLGSSPFGVDFHDGVTIDLADDEAPPPIKNDEGEPVPQAFDTKAWKGIVVHKAKFYLPDKVPLLGGRAASMYLSLGLSPPGISLRVKTSIKGAGSRPDINVLLECMDPTATGLGSFVPTLVEASMTLPMTESNNVPGAGDIQFAAGEPVTARARYARKPDKADPAAQEMSFTVESQGEAGLASFQGTSLPVRATVAAATLGSVLAAGKDTNLAGLISLGVGAANVALKSGSLVVRSAALASSGRELPTDKLQFTVDYTVATQTRQLEVGSFLLGMSDTQPLRLRVRDLSLSFNAKADGLNKLDLDFSKSRMEIEDPGRWITSDTNLFDVLGNRTGKGSFWIEVDLGLRADLGPVKVSGTTVRGTIDGDEKWSGSITGLSASIQLNPLISGDGGVYIEDKDNFRAALRVAIQPLGINAAASVERKGPMTQLFMAVDFPGPLPLANSGLAIYGIDGRFVANGVPDIPNLESLSDQLTWLGAPKFTARPGQNSYGLGAVIGTAPDFGFLFSANAGILVTAPTFGLRAGLQATVMGPRRKVSSANSTEGVATAQGFLSVDASAVAFGLSAKLQLPPVRLPILGVHVPIAGRFPLDQRAKKWYVYLGADGLKEQGRDIGPIRAELFPTLDLGIGGADAFLMIRGDGLVKFNGRDWNGAVVALGFRFDITLGVPKIVWAEVHASAGFALTLAPTAFDGLGTVGGSLNIGPFSIGIDSTIHICYLPHPQQPWIEATVCGSIDLWFDTLSECVTLSFNKPKAGFVPPVPDCPLDNDKHALVDDGYRVLQRLVTSRQDLNEDMAVWPDAIPLLLFSSAPFVDLTDWATRSNLDENAMQAVASAAKMIGNEQLSYRWTLKNVAIVDDDTDTPVAKTLSCAWLIGRMGKLSEQPQPLELAMLTPDAGLSLHALPDAGQSLWHKPLDDHAHECQLPPAVATAGWAVGELATRLGEVWLLPADPMTGAPLQSCFTVRMMSFFGPALLEVARHEWPISAATVPLVLPLKYSFVAPRLVPLQPFAMNGRTFHAGLQPELVAGPVAGEWVKVGFQFSERLIAGVEVWWVFEDTTETIDPRIKVVMKATDPDWQLSQPVQIGPGRWQLQWVCRSSAQSAEFIQLTDATLAVIGVYGVTESAHATAQAQNQASAASVKKKKQGSKNTDGKNSGTVRCVLEPGKVHRIDVDMEWSSNQSTKGEVKRKFYFKTRAKETTWTPRWDTAAFQARERACLPGMTSQPLFRPELVLRYLQGYTPATGTSFWFRKDPLAVQFKYGHVHALAGTYGFDLGFVVRRLDEPAPEQHIRPSRPQSLLSPTTTDLMTGPQRTIAEALKKSDCGFALPGLFWPLWFDGLDPLTWYMLVLQVTSRANADHVTRIDGASIRTSRWTDPADMLAGIGFVAAPEQAPGVQRGDIEVQALVQKPQTVDPSDIALERLLMVYGLDNWPLAQQPRLSHLWTRQAGGWAYVGVFVESPEPIDRPGRFQVAEKGLSALGTAINFDVHARDRTASRMLWATTTPVPIGPGSMLQLSGDDFEPPSTTKTADVIARLPLGTQPDFIA